MFKDYLGDSVYVELDEMDHATLILTTQNSPANSNFIYIEPAVWVALISYVNEYLPAKLAELRDTPGYRDPRLSGG